MRLSDHIQPGTVFLSAGRTRESLLPAMVGGICQQWNEGDPATLVELAWERERQGATAVGLGISIPHLRCGSLADLRIAVATHPEGTDFPSPDGRSVRLVFLLASPPAKAGAHVRALALVARLDEATVDSLASAPDPKVFLERLRQWEDRLGGPG